MERGESPTPDYEEATALASRVARIFGYDGLNIVVRPGAGWQTMRSENDITLVVDPEMLTPKDLKDATGKELPPGAAMPSEEYSMYGTCHELGHIEDMLHPSSTFEALKKIPEEDHFFWNVLDDAVINRRLRNIPLLNTLTDEVYKTTLFPVDDLSDRAKHLQFMYGLLLKNVTPQRDIKLSDDVQEALDGLEHFKEKFRKHDIYNILARPDTDLPMRRRIAERYILPIYHDFLEKDKEDQKDQQKQQGQQGQGQPQQGQSSGSGQPQKGQPSQGSGTGQPGTPQEWQDAYDAYKEATGCGDHGDKEDEHDKQSGGGDGQDEAHEAMQEAADALREKRAEESGNEAGPGGKQKGSSGNGDEVGVSGAGSIAEQLKLSPANAALYKSMVENQRAQIHEVSRIFQKLTVPSIEYKSPRYRRSVSTEGLQLSARDLFRVVVAQETGEDPVVWRPVETISKKAGFSFEGLDIHLVIDSSGSMGGSKAQSAAACCVLLMEGLEAARRAVQRNNPGAPKPDVRLQITLFGSSSYIVAPIGYEIAPEKKGQAFATVLQAASNSTIVAGALAETVKSALAHPERTQLTYIITDGEFSDTASAQRIINGAPSNYFPCQYILQSPSTHPIAKTYAHLSNENELPKNLKIQLNKLAQKLLS